MAYHIKASVTYLVHQYRNLFASYPDDFDIIAHYIFRFIHVFNPLHCEF
jgi:hypothetical protein